MLNVALIGFGAITQEVLKHIKPGSGVNLSGLIVREGRVEEVRKALPASMEVASKIDGLGTTPDLICECAGHAAVAEFGEEALKRGIDFLVISIGALANAEMRNRLEAAAKAGNAKLILPAGAVAGADALTAARVGGLERVTYTSRKPPGALPNSCAMRAGTSKTCCRRPRRWRAMDHTRSGWRRAKFSLAGRFAHRLRAMAMWSTSSMPAPGRFFTR